MAALLRPWQIRLPRLPRLPLRDPALRRRLVTVLLTVAAVASAIGLGGGVAWLLRRALDVDLSELDLSAPPADDEL